MDLPRIVESLLFATDRPLTPKAIANALAKAARFETSPETAPHEKTTPEEIEGAVAQLETLLAAAGSSLMVQGIAGGYLLKTRPEYSPWTGKLFEQAKSPKLSQPALETLAVIAYRQPIGRAEMEAVRGVAVDGVVATLLERKVIRVAGRSDQPGRPLLYETTPLFLELFGLKSLEELPNADELRRLTPPEISHAPNNNSLMSTLPRRMQLLRQKVDQIDLKVLRLIQQRTKLSGEIGRMKRRHRAVIYVPERERALLARLVRLSRGRLDPEVVAAVYREILSGSRAAQGQPPIAVLASSGGAVAAASGAVFGSCDRFIVEESWDKVAALVRQRKRSLALVSAPDLSKVLESESSRQEFSRYLAVAGELPREAAVSQEDAIFIITPPGSETGAKVNRLAILIECKSTPDAIKSLLGAMPELDLQNPPVSSPAKVGGRLRSTFAVLAVRPVAAQAKAVSRLQAAAHTAALPISVLGAYFSTEDHGG